MPAAKRVGSFPVSIELSFYMNPISGLFHIWKNMGTRYLLYRIGHEVDRRTGRLAKKFPVQAPELPVVPSLTELKSALHCWPWGAKENLDFPKEKNPALKEWAERTLAGEVRMFSGAYYPFTKEQDWITHPETGYLYNNKLHWTQIPDMSAEAGDIKYVWEKSRFTFAQTILRYDYHFEQDHSDWVFEQMDSWIRMNPINCGPNYRCSQEISLRVFNWLGILSFYRNSPHLTEDRWKVYFHHMYWQMHHVRTHIHFSRIAVRNNHAITETLALYLFGILFPQVKKTSEWKASGKKWVCEEILYQIYPDGSYLQFSMNYHRVVVQLLTLLFRVVEKAGEELPASVHQRALKTLEFLQFFQDPVSGWLPNYGANDGALFFAFTESHYRNYRPQLAALESALLGTQPKEENAFWFGKSLEPKVFKNISLPQHLEAFGEGGFAGIRESDALTFFRSGRHKDRPSQADNHHIDIWYQGKNLLRDDGSYKYNASEADIRYFFGTQSHNTVMVAHADQMLKGSRFIWYHWSQSIGLSVREEDNFWQMDGEIEAFRHVRPGIRHKRTIRKFKGKAEWWIEDTVTGAEGLDWEVRWHPSPDFEEGFFLEAQNEKGQQIHPAFEHGWYSGLYGEKEDSTVWAFRTKGKTIRTHISLKAIDQEKD